MTPCTFPSTNWYHKATDSLLHGKNNRTATQHNDPSAIFTNNEIRGWNMHVTCICWIWDLARGRAKNVLSQTKTYIFSRLKVTTFCRKNIPRKTVFCSPEKPLFWPLGYSVLYSGSNIINDE